MNAKEYLRQYKFIRAQLDSLRDAKQEAYSLLVSCGIKPDSDGISGNNGNSREKALVRYLDYSERLDVKYTELIRLQGEIENVIEQIEEPLQTLLRRRYIDCYSWETVSELIHYSRLWVIKRLHPDALREVQKILDRLKNGKTETVY